MSTAERERGFTIIEIMIVVVIIAVLAVLVVPGWFRESTKSRTKTEVNAVLAEITIKEEQYKVEKHEYLAATACPSAAEPDGVDFATTCLTGSSAWDNLRVNPPEKNVRCSYEITAGDKDTAPSPPTGFTMATPAGGWWYAVATCDTDAKGGVNSTFFISSVDTKVQIQNEGK
jgi:prepilin-type N-terminal cleavage/methylation domain-containing protein